MYMKKTITITLLFLMLFAFGCVSLTKKRIQHYENLINPKVGVATIDDVLTFAGPPTKREKINGREFWYYHIDYGTRSVPNPLASALLSYPVYSHQKMYEDIFLEFDERGILINWRVRVKR